MTAVTAGLLREHGVDLPREAIERAVRLAIAERRARLAGPSDRELTRAEVEVLELGGFDLGHREHGEADPVLRTIAAYAALIAGALTTSEVALRLGVASSRIRQRLAERSLYGIMPDTDWLLPEFQFEGPRTLPGLAQVVRALDPSLHPVSVDRFFASHDPELADPTTGRALSPRDWLRAGQPPATVARLAAQL
jgi:hypothetical protein